MPPRYLIAQAFGLLSTLCCLLLPQMPKKRQMLLLSGANNLFVILNVLLLEGFCSAVMVSAAAVLQVWAALRHLRKNTAPTKKESAAFLLLYICCGLLGFQRGVDVLPIVGAVFNMLATFQREEQPTRFFLLLNAATFAVYYILIGSTALFASICAITSAALGLWRCRKIKI